MVVSDSFACWDLQHRERAISTLALEDTKCSVSSSWQERWKRQVGRHSLEGLCTNLVDVVKQISVVRVQLAEGLLPVLLEAATDLGARSASHPVGQIASHCYTCLLEGEVIEPALADANVTKHVLGDSPDLPAGPALALQLALPAQTGQPAAAIMAAESSESGEILSAGLQRHSWSPRLHSRRSLRPCRRLLFKRLQIMPRRMSAGGIDVTCFLDGGRLTYEDSLAAHGYQRYRLKCTFDASSFKSRNAG